MIELRRKITELYSTPFDGDIDMKHCGMEE
jgi:hypothetical protein